MKKKLRVNKKYGEWHYLKEVDDWDASCWNYRLWGTDENGEQWFFSSVVSYQEMMDIVKSSKEEKERILNY